MATEEKEVKESKFLNPFKAGVSYKEFTDEVKKAKKSVSEYCKGKLTGEEIEWIEKELSILKTEQKWE